MNPSHFFIIGAQRSGTTYIYEVLDAHDEICMARPIKPEPKFFLRTNLSDYSYDDYLQSYFDESACKVRGEKTTTYIESELAAQQISKWFPTAKIIMILRNPIERAISNYQFSQKHKLETLSIEEAFLKEPARRDNYDHSTISASPYAYLKRGHYMNYIQLYEQYFPRKQIKILIHEEFVGQLEPLQQLYRWLLVDPNYETKRDLSYAVNASDGEKLELSDALQTYLIDHFAPSVANLEAYLGRSLNVWTHFNKSR